MELGEIAKAIESELDDKDSVREIAIKSSREIIRVASEIIMKLHRREECMEALRKIKEEVWHLKSLLLNEYPDLFYAGFVQNALQEYVEAMLLYHYLQSGELPGHQELNVNPGAYLLGAGDLVGELRREVLESLRNGDFTRAERDLSMMEKLYEMLMLFNYPSGLVPIKQKQDMARALVEKTRGEITIATMNRNLEEKMRKILNHESKI
ncbi:MAG: translin family protein [Euryarchaeota archaeon]|nr:translin family protein [Euryarchaeota archaeon]